MLPRYLLREILAGLILSIFFGTISLDAYQRIVIRERQSAPETPHLRLGTFSYGLFTSEGCFGALTTSFRSDSAEYFFTSHGFIRARLQGQDLESSFSSNASFNGLRQLVSSDSSVSAPNIGMRLITAGIRPTTLLATLQLNGVPYRYKTDFSTEFSLLQMSKNEFKLDGALLRRYSKFLNTGEKPKLIDTLDVEIREIPSERECSAEQSKATLNLAGALELLQSIAALNPAYPLIQFFNR